MSRPKASAARSWSVPPTRIRRPRPPHPAGRHRPGPRAHASTGGSVTPLETKRPLVTTSAVTASTPPVASTSRTADMSRIITVHPRTYNEARTIGEHFRDGVPVIMNLSEMEDVDAKRLVDFAAGLIFGLRGSIERVTSKVFLLVAAERQRDGGGQGAHRGRFLQPELTDRPLVTQPTRTQELRDSTHVHHRNRSSEQRCGSSCSSCSPG